MELDLKEVAAVEELVIQIDQQSSAQLIELQLAFAGGGLGETAI